MPSGAPQAVSKGKPGGPHRGEVSTHLPHPLGHDVGAGGAVMGVDDDDGDDDGCYDEHHGEEHVFPNQGHSAGGGRDQLHDDQKEHGQGQ